MSFVSVEELLHRISTIDDPVLRGKVQKALHLLHRTLELYRCAGGWLNVYTYLYRFLYARNAADVCPLQAVWDHCWTSRTVTVTAAGLQAL